MVFNLIIGF